MNTFDFIEVYKFPPHLCDNFIEYHKKNTEYKQEGKVGNGNIRKDIKQSTDVIFFNPVNVKFIKDFFDLLTKALIHYTDKYKVSVNLKTQDHHFIQHYKKKEGFYRTHYERMSRDAAPRDIVYMLYCNDVKEGGTNFPFQNKKLDCIKGDLVLWPAHFTHPHHGVISEDEEKYIVTGWFEIK